MVEGVVVGGQVGAAEGNTQAHGRTHVPRRRNGTNVCPTGENTQDHPSQQPVFVHQQLAQVPKTLEFCRCSICKLNGLKIVSLTTFERHQ